MTYRTRNENCELDIVNIYDLEKQFEQSMIKEDHRAALEFIVGGAGDEWTLRHNILDFDQWSIVPSVMNGLHHGMGNTRQQLLGIDLEMPIITAATAAHGLVHQQAEAATLKGTNHAGSLMDISTYSNLTLTQIQDQAGESQWFYQHSPDKDEGFNQYLLESAVSNGAKAIVLGVFGADFGRRERDLFNRFDFPVDLPFRQLTSYPSYPHELDIFEVNNRKRIDIQPELIEKIKKETNLPVIIKGIQTAEDARRAIDHGADAIWVSNTGGRQLDGARSSIRSLCEVANEVKKERPIIFDGGVRRGQHVFKALALGADVVAVGRPILYGLHLGGAAGVTSVLNHLQKELLNTMLLAGVQSIPELQYKSKLEKYD